MSQHDLNIANQGFPATRADLNNALAALASNSSGTSEPSTTYANQLWYDTTNDLLKFRNEADSAWIDLAYMNQTTSEWEIRSGVVQAVDSGGILFKTDEGTTRVTLDDSGNLLPLDASISLGGASNRFSDLYLSGGVHLGGTGSANKLDDVEEGTWTPSIHSGPTGVTYNSQEGYYFKIGSIVMVRFHMSFTCTGGAGAVVKATGLPFVQNTTGFSWMAAGSLGGSFNNGSALKGAAVEGTSNVFRSAADGTLSSTGTKSVEGNFLYSTSS